MKALIPIILVAVSPIIGFLICGVIIDSVYPVPKFDYDSQSLNDYADSVLAIQEKRNPFYLLGAFGGGAIGILLAIKIYRRRKMEEGDPGKFDDEHS